MTKRPVTARQAAEIVAIQALSFLGSDPGLLGRFLAETGLGPDTLRESVGDPEFLAGVLDFVLRSDETVKAFAGFAEIDPETVANAREALGPRWERDLP